MPLSLLRAALAALVIVAWPAAAEPDQLAAAPRKVALVIGNAAYDRAPALVNPVNDAVDVSSALAQLGFEIVEGYDLDYAAMRESVRDFARKLDAAEVGLVYFAGHGLQVDGRNYMLPVDAALRGEGSVSAEAIDLNDVLAPLSRGERVRIVLLDACRDNPLAADFARRFAAARSAAMGKGLAQVETSAPDTLIAYATSPGAVASDGAGRNSPFTAALLRHIETPGADISEVMRRVSASVNAATNTLQTPWISSSMTRAFSFVPGDAGAAVPPPDWAPPPRDLTPRQIEAGLWADVKDKGSIDELAAFLGRYPEGPFAAAARARIARLEKDAAAKDVEAADLAGRIAREFAALAGAGAIIAEPKTAQEHYANARIHELKGDYGGARRSYLAFFAAGALYVDPHYRFQTFLKVQEGRAGAREIYGEIAAAHPDDAIYDFAKALLLDREPRMAALDAFLVKRPDFAPAVYELARDYSSERAGVQTAEDRRRERELLARFVALAEKGEFLTLFLDQELAGGMLEDARARLAALPAIAEEALKNPLTVQTIRSNAGWSVFFNVADIVEEMFVSLGGGPYESTGFSASRDDRTGKPAPKTSIELPGEVGATGLSIKYRDARGREQGPYDYAFDPVAELAAGNRRILESFANAWISHREDADYPYTYFTHVLSYRCAIKEVRYGWDEDEPKTLFPLPPCDRRNPFSVPSDALIYIPTDKTAKAMMVRLVYQDGTVSKVQRFPIFGR